MSHVDKHNLAELRRKLSEEFDTNRPDLQEPLIERLRREHGHSISLIHRADTGERRDWHFNCHAFALRLNDWDEFFDLVKHEDVYPDGRFVSDVMIPQMVEKPAIEATDGDVAVYFEGNRVVHSGIVAGDRIRSKWGAGHVWEHGVFEMLTSYGSSVRYFATPSAGPTRDAFRAYACEQVARARARRNSR